MHVTESIEFVLKPNSPYDFARTVGHVTGNAGEYALDKFVDGTYTRVLSINDQHVLLSVQSSEGLKQTELVCNLSALDGRPHDAEEFQNIISWMFSVDEDLSEFYGMASKDPLMHDLIKEFHGLQILRSPSLFESIVLSILGQQISAAVARKMRSELIKIYGGSFDFKGNKYYFFPPAEKFSGVTSDDLRGIGLSRRKAEYILGVAKLISSGLLSAEILKHKSDADVLSALTSIDGIGPWTANWLSIRALGRPDGFPANDLALRRALTRLSNAQEVVTEKEAQEMSLKWIPHRSLVTTYLFAALRNGAMK